MYFIVGASHYGIGDLEALAGETHKFESRYCDNLLAPLTAENMHIYYERSPIKHIDQFNCAVAFFQGDEDKVCCLQILLHDLNVILSFHYSIF